jgi:ABC-2 type transport system permease protein
MTPSAARDWTAGARLVAARQLKETLRTRTVKVVTAALVLMAVAAIVLPQVFGGGRTTYTLATVGRPAPALTAVLDSAGRDGDFSVKYLSRGSVTSVREAVRSGDAAAGLVTGRLFTSATSDGTFAGMVTQAVVGLETSRRLAVMGLDATDLARLQAVRPPEQVPVESKQEQARRGVAFAAGIVLYLAITFAGSAIATAVAVEKSSRISEVLLAMLRPSQVLVGTVTAVGAVALGQLLLLAVPVGIAVRLNDKIGLPQAATGDLALAVVWFLLGFLLYAFVFAATAALVNRITEVSAAIFPVTATLVAAYLIALIVVMPDPHSGWSTTASLFPLTAPLAMPIRWATGTVPAYQLVLSLVLAVLTAAFLVRASSAIYGRALVATGRRLGPRAALRLLRTVDGHTTAR